MIKKFLIKNSTNLASPILGTKIHSFSDQFFAAASRILRDNEPVFKDGLFDNNGKWMDGWETRRKRVQGNDFIIIKLGKPGRIDSVLIDTSFFNGNQPEFASIEGCFSSHKSLKKNLWTNILKKKKLNPNKKHFFKSSSNKTFNFVRLNIFPDGGIARLRLMGDIDLSKEILPKNKINLASILNGSKIIACSDEHFGKAENLLAPGKSKNMGNGWETGRRRGPGYDWVIIKLGRAGNISSFEVNTHYFKGNYPSHFSVQANFISNDISIQKIVDLSKSWKYILNNNKLKPNSSLSVKNNLMLNNKINLIKLNIFPDGGISRLRIYGKAILN
jgi:allantoicase